MVGKFPACVLHLNVPVNAVDVNVHPAKTEVKFLNEKAVFDCVHYGVLGALNKTPDRPQMQFKSKATAVQDEKATPAPKQESFFRTMSPQEYKQFSAAVKEAPKPRPEAAVATAEAIRQSTLPHLRETVSIPKAAVVPVAQDPVTPVFYNSTATLEEKPVVQSPAESKPEFRLVGELYKTYILVEQGEDAYLIDKHAAHERILFEKLKANQEAISSQLLLTPIVCHLRPDAAATLLSNQSLLQNLGFEIDEFGQSTVLLRQIPMDLSPEDAAEAAEAIAADLMDGRQEQADTVRDAVLHTVACKAAIKAGWHTDEKELLALATQVMAREDLKYCPHGRPICIGLSKKQLEKQFKR